MTLISRDYLGSSAWKLRARSSWSVSAPSTYHPPPNYVSIETNFLATADSMIQVFNYHATASPNLANIRYIGNVGFYVPKAGWHGEGRAGDLSQLEFTNDTFVCTSWSWRQSDLTNQRKYLGMVAGCRRSVSTVLTRWTNVAHEDHIHFDDGATMTSLRPNQPPHGGTTSGKRNDTLLVQAAANLLAGASLTVDGIWGAATEDAYIDLLERMDMKCLDPKVNTSHAVIFFDYISWHGLAAAPAGTYTYFCSTCC